MAGIPGELEEGQRAVFGRIPWQRCQFHVQQNAQGDGPLKGMQAQVAEDIRTSLNPPDHAIADAFLARVVLKYEKTAAGLVSCASFQT